MLFKDVIKFCSIIDQMYINFQTLSTEICQTSKNPTSNPSDFDTSTHQDDKSCDLAVGMEVQFDSFCFFLKHLAEHGGIKRN